LLVATVSREHRVQAAYSCCPAIIKIRIITAEVKIRKSSCPE
jgi:hypothetical protein